MSRNEKKPQEMGQTRLVQIRLGFHVYPLGTRCVSKRSINIQTVVERSEPSPAYKRTDQREDWLPARAIVRTFRSLRTASCARFEAVLRPPPCCRRCS